MTDNLGEFSSSGQSVYIDSDNSLLRESVKTRSDGNSSASSNKSYGDNFLSKNLVYAASMEKHPEELEKEEEERPVSFFSSLIKSTKSRESANIKKRLAEAIKKGDATQLIEAILGRSPRHGRSGSRRQFTSLKKSERALLYHICKNGLLPPEYRGVLWLRASGAAPCINLSCN